jgi:hypothetical protein
MNSNQPKDDDDDTVTLPEHNIMPDISTTTTTSTTSSTRIVLLGKNTDPASQLDTKHDDEHSKTKQQQQQQQQQAISKQSSIQVWSFFLESLKKIFAHEFFSERHHHRTHSHTRSSPTTTTTTTTATTTTTTHSSPCCGHSSRVPPRVLLQDCKTSQEHFERIQDILSKCKTQSGLLGLESIGFTYRRYHKKCHYAADAKEESITRNEDKRVGVDYNISSNNNNNNNNNMTESSLFNQTRLLHMPTNTWITKQNREMYIADGDMYEEVVRMCQEYAQDLMMEEASLHWVSVCEEKEKGNPIRILVDRNYPIHTREQGNGSASTSTSSSTLTTAHQDEDSHHEEHVGSDLKKESICDKDTLLITTGKGKVRAGIFSRQHLLISSIEASTALPMVRDAKRRNMYIAILDPNARGDRYGMTTYQQSMEVLFGASTNASPTSSSSCSLDKRTASLYILAHSASGSQLARYLLQTNGDNLLLSRIKSIAFTDSNHSIQWLKHHSHISSLFQSSAALYVRSSNPCRDDGWERHKCGDIVDTWRDEHWLHRFGQVPTIWAGTTDHSLTNYTSHSFIWEHFDKCKYCEDRVVDDSVQKER